MFFSYYSFFSDISKGLEFIKEITQTGSYKAWLPKIFQDIGWIVWYVIACLSFFTSYLDYKKGLKKSSSLLITCGIIIIILTFPLFSHKWLWRFNLMVFVPSSIVVGKIVGMSKERVIRVIICILVAALIFNHTITLIRTLRPTISLEEYNELNEMRYLVPKGSFILSPQPLSYWAEYVLDCKLLKRNEKPNATYFYIVMRKDFRKPFIPKQEILYIGKRLILIKVKPPYKP
jgi:hypothetical protein